MGLLGYLGLAVMAEGRRLSLSSSLRRLSSCRLGPLSGPLLPVLPASCSFLDVIPVIDSVSGIFLYVLVLYIGNSNILLYLLLT